MQFYTKEEIEIFYRKHSAIQYFSSVWPSVKVEWNR